MSSLPEPAVPKDVFDEEHHRHSCAGPLERVGVGDLWAVGRTQ